jgi:hypothetical protein
MKVAMWRGSAGLGFAVVVVSWGLAGCAAPGVEVRLMRGDFALIEAQLQG